MKTRNIGKYLFSGGIVTTLISIGITIHKILAHRGCRGLGGRDVDPLGTFVIIIVPIIVAGTILAGIGLLLLTRKQEMNKLQQAIGVSP